MEVELYPNSNTAISIFCCNSWSWTVFDVFIMETTSQERPLFSAPRYDNGIDPSGNLCCPI